MTKNIGLIILDGWGIGDRSKSDAIFNARTQFMDHLINKYPSAELLTSGEDVGLPDGQMGNSEVGHLNIGAGRIVYQELTRINKAIRDGEFAKNEVLKRAFQEAKETGKKLHFMGLVSNGGVHSSQEHLHALCNLAKEYKLKDVFIHAFTDGRDCDPRSGINFIKNLEENIEETPVKIASIIGRYYAMDRDNRWERIRKAYDLMVNGQGEKFESAEEIIKRSYENDVTDEFIEPSVIHKDGAPVAVIEEGDIVICFNFRTDRPREISTVLTQKDFPQHQMEKLNISYFTMTNYDRSFKNVNVIFEKEVLSDAGQSQVRIAETEKYPHVTFFFSGGREKEFEGEKRILVNSPKVATYDLQPEMSAPEVRDRIVREIKENAPNFICLNFANPDMVGHTGIYNAIINAVETVDRCLKDVVTTGLENGYEFIVIADHGNADYAINPDGSPNTAHSLNPVPVILVTEEDVQLNNGVLADVAPSLLDRLGIDHPSEMTGKSLIRV
jgi:2,3-bisphosphoglycerate-independent phosphoglycerate mutase